MIIFSLFFFSSQVRVAIRQYIPGFDIEVFSFLKKKREKRERREERKKTKPPSLSFFLSLFVFSSFLFSF